MATVTTYMCRSCRSSCSRSPALRTFATSSRRNAIPPESPNYVDIPESFQVDFNPARKQKGVLPVPREIFPPQRPDKPTEEYLSRSAPLPKRSASSPSKRSEQANYKSRMSDLRRNHLRSGLLELYNRKIVMTQAIAAKSVRRQNERARLISQPAREDERLTSISIPSSMRIMAAGSSPASDTATKTTTTAAATHAGRVALTESKASSKRLARLDALHTLYMHARAFITTEAQLGAEIDRVFDNPEATWGTAASRGSNIWNLGPPVSVATLLREMSGISSGAAAAVASGAGRIERESVGMLGRAPGADQGNSHKYRTDQARLKKLAEALSGGTM